MDVLGEPRYNISITLLGFLVPYVVLSHRSFAITKRDGDLFNGLLRPCLSILTIGHTLYHLQLLISPPINLFSLLNLPLNAPLPSLRSALLEHQKDKFPVMLQNKLLPHVETLLTRLSSFESRTIYVKYGPYPLSMCGPCVYASDFIVFSIAPTVLPYLCTLLLTSLVTSYPAERPAWRTPSMVTLAAALITEIWWAVQGTVQFGEGKLNGWTQTHTYIARHTLLLLLPLIVHNLPAHSSLSALPPFIDVPPSRPVLPHQAADFHLSKSTPRPKTSHHPSSSPTTLTLDSQNAPPNTPITALTGILATCTNALGVLRILELTRITGLRRHDLREQISDYFEADNQCATFARSDPALHQEAERLGMGYHTPRPKRNDHTKRSDTERRPKRNGALRPEKESTGDAITSDDEDRDRDRRTPANSTSGEDENDEDEALDNSPLRAKARQAAQDIKEKLIRRMGSLQPGNRKEGGVKKT